MDWLSWHFTSALGVPAPARGNQGEARLPGRLETGPTLDLRLSTYALSSSSMKF